jgi:hypothetical protein
MAFVTARALTSAEALSASTSSVSTAAVATKDKQLRFMHVSRELMALADG